MPERLTQYDTYDVPIHDIFYDATFNCCGPFTLESIHELAESIRLHTLQEPVIIQPWGQNEFPYRLLAGHRRFMAVARVLQSEVIPARIRSGLTEHEARILNFTENLERKDLNPLEEAMAIHRLYPEAGTMGENDPGLRRIAKELQRPTRWVHDRQRLLKLSGEIQQWAAAGLIAMCTVPTLMKLPPDEQLKAAPIVENKRKYGKTAAFPGTTAPLGYAAIAEPERRKRFTQWSQRCWTRESPDWHRALELGARVISRTRSWRRRLRTVARC